VPILTSAQIFAAAQQFAQQAFVTPNVTANLSMTQIQAGITAIDTAMSLTPSAYASTYSGLPNTASGLGSAVLTAVPAATDAQAGLMLVLWTEQAAEI
jgi:hypothetical protein